MPKHASFTCSSLHAHHNSSRLRCQLPGINPEIIPTAQKPELLNPRLPPVLRNAIFGSTSPSLLFHISTFPPPQLLAHNNNPNPRSRHKRIQLPRLTRPELPLHIIRMSLLQRMSQRKHPHRLQPHDLPPGHVRQERVQILPRRQLHIFIPGPRPGGIIHHLPHRGAQEE